MQNIRRQLRILIPIGLAAWGALAIVTDSRAESGSPSASSLAGTRLIYRFDSGRTYRADYADETVHFTLLEPPQPDPPSETLAYTARKLRDGLFLVVWRDVAFHTTFVVDLARREIPASALREGTRSFFATAEILEANAWVSERKEDR